MAHVCFVRLTDIQGAPSSLVYGNISHSHNEDAWCSLLVGVCAQPTLVVTVSRGFPSEDALLGSSFSTIATALESVSYNSEINSELCQFALGCFQELCGFRVKKKTLVHYKIIFLLLKTFLVELKNSIYPTDTKQCA